jgi:2-C-methyl-D-erythritol 4-phosphate cytidylyltransferase
MSLSVVVPAGGIGKRFSANVKKQFYKLDGFEIIYYTFLRLKIIPCNEIIIGCNPSDEEYLADILRKAGIVNYSFAPAGAERCHTVMNCLEAATGDYVLIHDAVRPFVSSNIIEKMLSVYEEYDGLICGIKPKDTVKQINDEDAIERTIDRNSLILVHTPQIFNKKILVKCLGEIIEKNIPVTDEAMALEYFHYEVRFVESRWYNIKITTQEDLHLGEYIIRNFDSIAGC